VYWWRSEQATVAVTTQAIELLPHRCELACVEIGGYRDGAARRIREGHIAVRPYQINGIAQQARSTHLGTPRKDAQRQFSPITHCPDLGGGVAIHVDLPVHRSQWREVVGIHAAQVRLHPRQTVTAVNRSRSPLTQATSPVVHRCL